MPPKKQSGRKGKKPQHVMTKKGLGEILRFGDLRASAKATEDFVEYAKNHGLEKAEKVAKNAGLIAKNAGRKTVMEGDIEIAARMC